jgi:hypothetical protein
VNRAGRISSAAAGSSRRPALRTARSFRGDATDTGEQRVDRITPPRTPATQPYNGPTRPHGLAVQDACLSRRRSRVRIPLGVSQKSLVNPVIRVWRYHLAQWFTGLGTTRGYQTRRCLNQGIDGVLDAPRAARRVDSWTGRSRSALAMAATGPVCRSSTWAQFDGLKTAASGRKEKLRQAVSVRRGFYFFVKAGVFHGNFAVAVCAVSFGLTQTPRARR